LVDQLLSSGTNFLMVILIARFLGPRAYGSFTLAMATWFTLLGVVRAAIVQPYVVEASRQEGSSFRSSTRQASGAIVAAGVLGGVIMATVGLALGLRSPVGSAFVILGLLSPFLVLQDFWRFAAFARQKAWMAVVNDGTCALVQLVGLFLFFRAASRTPALAMGVWGAGGIAGAFLGMVQFGLRPSLGAATVAWVRRVGRWGKWFGFSNGVYAAANQVVAIIVAAEAGSAALGGLRAVQSLIGPAQLVAASGDSVALPAASRQFASDGHRGLTSFQLRYGTLLAVLLGLYGLALWVAHTTIIRVVLGPRYLPYGYLVLPLALALVMTAGSSSGGLGLRAVLAGRQLAAVETCASIVQIATIATLLHFYGLIGAAWGILITSVFHSTAVWWMYLVVARSGLRRVEGTEHAEPFGG
jgi:O-antigen/teichoic acid export membrane protein